MRLSFAATLEKPPLSADGAPAMTRILQSSDTARPRDDAYFELKTRMHRQLIDRLKLSSLSEQTPDAVRRDVVDLVAVMLREDALPLNEEDSRRLIDDLMNELLGFGPLEPLLRDPDISDILVNTANEVYIERHGQIELTDIRFADEQHLLRVIERIVDKVGRRIDEGQPMVDARLPDGSRINAVVPPIAVDGAQLSIRRFAYVPYNLERLVANGTVDQPCADMLRGMVAARLNIVISGGTGTGKTTLLNAMSHGIGTRERIVTIEDAAELQLQQRHVVRMETRPSNVEGRGEVTQRDLVRNALRMRPDRIVLGEVRSGEAFDMLQAMNTGHDGSMTTVHANSPRDALARLEQMVSMAGLDLPTRAVRAQIASAINVVVQLKRFPDGVRRVISVQELEGLEGDVITMQEVFRFEQSGVSDSGRVLGRFVWTGIRPAFLDAFRANGVPEPDNLRG